LIVGATPPPSVDRHSELGDFLRRRRGEVQPQDVGLEAGERRRTPGLRREEVAQLAGVSISWYTWLEQGRDVRPSPSVLDAIARVLRFDRAERAHLFHLARVERPLAGRDYPREAPPELAALVHGLDPYPSYLMTPRTDLLAWNRAAAVVITDFGAAPNLLRWLLLERVPADPRWEPTARHTLARFRAEHARFSGHPDFDALVAELEAESPAFRAWWPDHEVMGDQGGTKAIVHGALGPLLLHHVQTVPSGHPELRLVVYAPGDDATRAALAAVI
jgi:transcriptional regulator with XRE-family HTH domain